MTKRVVRHLLCKKEDAGAFPKNITIDGRLKTIWMRPETATERRARHLKEQKRLGHYVPASKGPRPVASYRGAQRNARRG